MLPTNYASDASGLSKFLIEIEKREFADTVSVSAGVTCLLRMSPDRLLIGCEDGAIALADLSEGVIHRLITTDGASEEKVTCLALAGDGKAVSGSVGNLIRVWDLRECSQLAVLAGHTKEVNALKVTEDGKCVSAAEDCTVRVWDLAENAQIAVLEGHTEGVKFVQVTQDGRGVTGSSDKTVRVWDLQEYKCLAVLEGHAYYITALILTADNKCLSGSFDETVRLWDLGTYTQLAVFKGHFQGITSVEVAGQICVSGSWDNTLRVWDLRTYKQLAVLQGHSQQITGLKVTQDGRCLSASADASVRLWDLADFSQIAVFEGHSGEITCLELSASQEKCITGSADASIKLWDLREYRESRTLEGHENLVFCSDITTDGKYLSGSWDNTIRVWDVRSNTLLAVLEGHTKEVYWLRVTADGRKCVSGAADATLRVWDLTTYKEIAVLEGHTEDIYSLKLSKGLCVSGSVDKTVRVWDIEQCKLLAVLEGHEADVYDVEVTGDGKCISASADTTVRVWSLKELRQLAVLQGHSKEVQCVKSTEDGRCLSGSWDSTIRVWDLTTYTCLATMTGHSQYVTCLQVTGSRCVSCSADTTLIIWDLTTYTLVSVLEGHTAGVFCLRLTPDNRCLSGSEDNTIRIWDLEGCDQLAVLRGHTGRVYCLEVTEDGLCVSGSADSSIRITDISPYSLRYHPQPGCLSPTNPAIHYFTKCAIPCLKSGPVSSRLYSWNIPGLWVNVLHVSTLFNNKSLLRAALLRPDCHFLRGHFGSPLTLALQLKLYYLVETILDYFISLVQSDQLTVLPFAMICDDLPSLLVFHCANLEEFMSVLMQPHRKYPEPILTTTKQSLPLTDFSCMALPPIEKYCTVQSTEASESNVLLRTEVSTLRWNFTAGSDESLGLLKALQRCPYSAVLLSKFAETLITEKWRHFWWAMLALTLGYFLMLGCLITCVYWENWTAALCFVVLNGLLLGYEVVELLATGREYLSDAWNYVDLLRGVLSALWGMLCLCQIRPEQSFSLCVVALCFIRGFTYFRTFKMTREYVYLTIQVIKEVYTFLLILAYSVLSFGVLASMLRDNDSLDNAWTNAYNLTMGDFDSSGYSALQLTIFTAATTTNIVIMLNLLISILGEAYEKTQMTLRENDLLLQLDAIIEFESMLFCRRNSGKRNFMITVEEAESRKDGDWNGKILKITSKIEKKIEGVEAMVRSEVAKKLGSVEEQVQTMQGKMETFEVKLTGIEQQLLTIVGLLQKTG